MMSIAFVIGCQKEDVGSTTSILNVSEESVKLKGFVDRFNSKLNTDFKSEEILSVDSAHWYIETALNYNYCQSMKCESYVTDSVKYVVECGDNIVMSDVVATYNYILESIASRYHSLSEENKILDFVAIESHDVDGKVVFAADYVIGLTPQDNGVQTHYKSSNVLQTEFGPTDYWKPVLLAGKCGPYEDQCVGRDATTELTRVGKECHVYKPNPPQSCRAIWTDISDEHSGRGSGQYSLWIGTDNECISPEWMNFYLKQSIPMILRGGVPSGFYCNYLYIRHDIIVGSKAGYSHFLDFKYGKVNIVPRNDLIELPCPPPSSELAN